MDDVWPADLLSMVWALPWKMQYRRGVVMSRSTVQSLTPPFSSDLITISQVKLYLGESGTDNDTFYLQLISAASWAMIQFLGVHPIRQRYEEKAWGHYGCPLIYLSRLPVESGTLTVTVDGVDLTEATSYPADSSSYIFDDPATGQLYRTCGWGSVDRNKITYHAGFLAPDQVSRWTALTSYSQGLFASPSSLSSLRYECTTAGVSDTTEPVWPTVIGSTVTDGTVTWTARAAQELPPFVSQWCYVEFIRLLGNNDWTPGVAERTVEGVSESRFATQTGDELSVGVMKRLQGWRKELGVVGVA